MTFKWPRKIGRNKRYNLNDTIITIILNICLGVFPEPFRNSDPFANVHVARTHETIFLCIAHREHVDMREHSYEYRMHFVCLRVPCVDQYSPIRYYSNTTQDKINNRPHDDSIARGVSFSVTRVPTVNGYHCDVDEWIRILTHSSTDGIDSTPSHNVWHKDRSRTFVTIVFGSHGLGSIESHGSQVSDSTVGIWVLLNTLTDNQSQRNIACTPVIVRVVVSVLFCWRN